MPINKYFKQGQVDCIIAKCGSIIQENKETFKDLKFKVEGLSPVLTGELYYIDVIITEIDSGRSKSIELSEFCSRFDISVDYSMCF